MKLRALAVVCLAVALAAVPLSANATPVVTPQLAILPPGSIPSSIAIDDADNIYTSNIGSQTISKITPAGSVTSAFATLPGSGIRRIVVDSIGDIFTANFTSGTMTRIRPDGSVETTYPLGAGSAPTALAIAPDGTIYTAKSGLNAVSSLNPSRIVLDSNFAMLAAGSNPTDITVDHMGNIYTLNSNFTVSKITPAGVVTPAFATLPATTSAGNIVVNSAGYIYVADFAGQRIEQFDSTGSYNGSIAVAANIGRIALDDNDNIFVALPAAKTVAMVSAADGTLTPSIAPLTPGADYFTVAVTPDDVVVAAGYTNPTVSRIELGAAVTSAAPTASGTVGTAYSFEVTASGYDPLAFRTVGTPPPGITIDPVTGVLSGTPTTAGSYTFEIVASNMFGDSTRQSATIAVAAAPVPTPTPTPTTTPATSTPSAGGTSATGGTGGSRSTSGELARTGGVVPEMSVWFGGAGVALLAGIGGLAIRRRLARVARR